MGTEWAQLDSGLVGQLSEALLQCHHAAQYIPRLARAYVPSRPDDSNTTLQWEPLRKMLVSEAVSTRQGEFRLGLRLRDLTLVAGEEFPLSGRTLADGMAWLEALVGSFGFDPSALSEPLHYEIPDHPVTDGEPFRIEPIRTESEELERYFVNAAGVLEEVRESVPGASAVRCWPHHFDIATLITLEGSGEQARTIGVGLSPGDQNYAHPYFYVTPWPYPNADDLPHLPLGAWHTAGWVGAILGADEFTRQPTAMTQREMVKGFLKKSIKAARSL